MKTIGLLGGMSWESTALYYRIINEQIREQLGGLHSARPVMYSVDFQQIGQLQMAGKWQEAGAVLSQAGESLQRAGADFLVLCTNTMHKVAEDISAAVTIPLLHIADATACEIRKAGISRVGLLGTAFTMEQDFYKGRLQDRHGIEVLIPNEEQRQQVHEIIYHQLCQGEIRAESRQIYQKVMASLAARGAEAIILGCTEITLLVSQQDAEVPLFDTTQIHALEAVRQALEA